ncbi:hypothetical protein FRC11_006768 [Ceratobasidium sp. 423]|nr:hypothetical protein FRC11_006768 [Ceratobasidium sp. 423]
MGKKAAKSTRKFAKSGELKRTIQARRKYKAVKAKVQARKGTKRKEIEKDEDEDEDEGIEEPKVKGNTVDDLLNGDLMEEQEEGEESDDEEDAESLGSMDEEEDQGKSISQDSF